MFIVFRYTAEGLSPTISLLWGEVSILNPRFTPELSPVPRASCSLPLPPRSCPGGSRSNLRSWGLESQDERWKLLSCPFCWK